MREDAIVVRDRRRFGEQVKAAALVASGGVSDECDVVMDAVGKDTFDGSLGSLRPLGMMISFGNASGPVPPFEIGLLGKKGSLKITRPTLFTHIGDHATCQDMAAHLGRKVLSGDVRINIGQRFALRDVAAAHEALEARKTTGSTILEI